MELTPTAQQMFLGNPAGRGLFQGDVFRDVPFTKVGQGNSPDDNPAWSAKRSFVSPILYPCDMVARDNVTLVRAQAIVRVYDAQEVGLRVSDKWDDVPLGICPLPDLHGDGRMWVADFRTTNVIDRSYLTCDRRVRCLSEFGWAVFRQRLAASGTRAEIEIEDLIELGAATWAESEMESEWVATGRERIDFHVWLDEQRHGDFATYRDALDEGELDLVRRALEFELI